MLTVINKNGQFTGTQYHEDLEKYRAFHINQGEICVWYTDEITEIDSETGETVYKTFTNGDLVDFEIENKKKEINNYRDSIIGAGFTYTFPDETIGTIELDERSVANIHGIVTSALVINSFGAADSLKFRDYEDVTHELSATETLLFGKTVFQYYSCCFETAWDHKDAVALLLTEEDINAYDFSTNWPTN